MMDKKKSVLELLIFGVLLIAILLYGCFNKKTKDKETQNAGDNKVVETIIPSPAATDVQKKENNENNENTTTQTSMPSSVTESKNVEAVKADEYYQDFDNSDGNKIYNTSQPNTDVEVKDGIEIIPNPQEGVQ